MTKKYEKKKENIEMMKCSDKLNKKGGKKLKQQNYE